MYNVPNKWKDIYNICRTLMRTGVIWFQSLLEYFAPSLICLGSRSYLSPIFLLGHQVTECTICWDGLWTEIGFPGWHCASIYEEGVIIAKNLFSVVVSCQYGIL